MFLISENDIHKNVTLKPFFFKIALQIIVTITNIEENAGVQ